MLWSERTWKGTVISIHTGNDDHDIICSMLLLYPWNIEFKVLNNKSIQIPNTEGLVRADRLFFTNCCLGDSLPL